MKLKSVLSDLGFTDVVACLEEAEMNLIEKKPSKQFNVDIGTLGSRGMLRREEKRMIEDTYSYLAEVCHGRIESLDVGKVNYALKDAYMRVDLLLKAYNEYISNSN